MLVFRRSLLTGIVHSMEIDVTQEQMDRFDRGEKVQHVFPHLDADKREFILNGITPEEWKEYVGEDNDD